MAKDNGESAFWNVGQAYKPNGCFSETTYQYCKREGWVEHNTRCRHPHINNSRNKITGKWCRPCHPDVKYTRGTN